LYLQVLRALYGMLVAALLWHRQFREDLESVGFKFNVYDPCVANRKVRKKQQTVKFHVDDLMSEHVDYEYESDSDDSSTDSGSDSDSDFNSDDEGPLDLVRRDDSSCSSSGSESSSEDEDDDDFFNIIDRIDRDEV
jgi:hypothetical protein